MPEIATNIDTLGLEQRVTDTTQLGDAKRITVGSMDATDQQSIKEWIALRQPREMAEMLAYCELIMPLMMQLPNVCSMVA